MSSESPVLGTDHITSLYHWYWLYERLPLIWEHIRCSLLVQPQNRGEGEKEEEEKGEVDEEVDEVERNRLYVCAREV